MEDREITLTIRKDFIRLELKVNGAPVMIREMYDQKQIDKVQTLLLPAIQEIGDGR